jgi:Fur family ferric uptake transcriptional regulator
MTPDHPAHSHAADHSHESTRPHDVIRTRGRRLTRQRRLIWTLLTAEGDNHLSADRIVELAQQRMPSLHTSTVYRTLDMLVEDGLVLRTNLRGDRAYYEPAHEHRHHHIVCETCGKVAHLHDDVLGDLPVRVEVASGYMLSDAEITFSGRCSDCSA